MINQNACDLERDLEWFSEVLDARLKSYFGMDDAPASLRSIEPPKLDNSDSSYARFLHEYDVAFAERIIILLALIPHIRPQLLDVLWAKNEATDRGFTEFGGLHGTAHSGFLPSGETAAFLVAGDDLAERFRLKQVFGPDHFFAHENMLELRGNSPTEPELSGMLSISQELVYRITTGSEARPDFNNEFPARRITTQMNWDDLILPDTTLEQLEEIRHWILYGQELLHEWEMGRNLPPGFTSLFYGPPGTGKTLSACLLGRHCSCDVYKIDLSMIISKYVGETEKRLAKVFDKAEHKKWILFFDEADALFGKRTQVDDAHDRYANQEVSFLLQRIEEFDGVVILASNVKGNIDDAFLRRFQSVVSFSVPRADERLRIWKNAFSHKAELEDSIDLGRTAERHHLTGGTIMNVVRYSSLKALSRNTATILRQDVDEGIRREFLKEGKTV